MQGNRSQTLEDLGENEVISQIINELSVNSLLMHGFGHDSAFLDITIEEDETLLLNTDRSGINIAYSLGLDEGNCVGDFAVSHAVSDILASGGTPISVTTALLLPANLDINFIKQVMIGADEAAKKYNAFIACGDTKKNSKFAMVVTAIGKCKKSQILTRSGAKDGDLIVVTGDLGTMISGYLSFKNNLVISNNAKDIFTKALLYQNPPHIFSQMISSAKIANACMDNSDGLSGSLYSLCSSSGVGALVHKKLIPIHPESRNIARQLSFDDFQLSLGSGDWQFLYAVPRENIQHFFEIAQKSDTKVTVIGTFTNSKKVIIESNNEFNVLNRIENDRFSKANSFFETITQKISILGEKVKL